MDWKRIFRLDIKKAAIFFVLFALVVFTMLYFWAPRELLPERVRSILIPILAINALFFAAIALGCLLVACLIFYRSK